MFPQGRHKLEEDVGANLEATVMSVGLQVGNGTLIKSESQSRSPARESY